MARERTMSIEDVVILDTLFMLVTAPIWIFCFGALAIAGAWNDWRNST